MKPYYESVRGASEYLLFHYCQDSDFFPQELARGALNFPARCASECLDQFALPPGARALDLGCAVGRLSFELARRCSEVIGIDYSESFVAIARRLKRYGTLTFNAIEEGGLARKASASVPAGIDRKRVRFQQGDAMRLPPGLGVFDIVLMANLIDRLPDPAKCLAQLPGLVKPGGLLAITSPYTWLSEYTPPKKWLGGFQRAGKSVRTLDTLTRALSSNFDLVLQRDLPFLIREHARKFQLGIAQATVWRSRNG